MEKNSVSALPHLFSVINRSPVFNGKVKANLFLVLVLWFAGITAVIPRPNVQVFRHEGYLVVFFSGIILSTGF